MSFDFGSFAGGVSKTWDSKAIGGAINQGMLNQDVQAAEDKAKEDQAALEHLKKAQAEKGHRVQDDTGEMFTYGASRAVDDDWVKKQQERSANNRTEAIKTAYTKWKSPEAYNNYLKSEAEGSKASFEKFVTDGKMGFAKELRDLRNNKAAMVEKAVEMGQLPQGSVFDPKSGQVLTPGQNGQMVPMPISDADINSFMDSYELQGWRKFGAGIDDFQKGLQAEIALATKGDQIEAVGLKNKETKAKINYLNTKGKADLITAGNKGKGTPKKPGKFTYQNSPTGDPIQMDELGKPTGLKLSPDGQLYEGAFGDYAAYQNAVSKAAELGITRQTNQETGGERYVVNGKAFPNFYQAFSAASKSGGKKKQTTKTAPTLSPAEIAKRTQQNKGQREQLGNDDDAQMAIKSVDGSRGKAAIKTINDLRNRTSAIDLGKFQESN